MNIAERKIELSLQDAEAIYRYLLSKPMIEVEQLVGTLRKATSHLKTDITVKKASSKKASSKQASPKK